MILLVVSVAALVVAIGLSLAIGTRPVPPHVVLDVILGRPVDPQDYHAVAVLRFPRTVVGLLAGIGLGVAGAVMQALTRNPLADPGLLGSPPVPPSSWRSRSRLSVSAHRPPTPGSRSPVRWSPRSPWR